MLSLSCWYSLWQYEHTKQLEAPIDLTIPGFEGLQYTFTARPRPGVPLRRSAGAVVNKAVLRTLYMERSRQVLVDFPADKDAGTNEFCVREESSNAARSALMANDKLADELFSELPNDEEIKRLQEEHRENTEFAEARELQRMQEKAAAAKAAGGANPNMASLKRMHLPPTFRQDSAVASIASSVRQSNEYYDRYHIFVEYERWVEEELGKDITKTSGNSSTGLRTTHISEKLYYPHVMDEVIKEQVANAPNYYMTRTVFGGKRVVYPEEVMEEIKKNELPEEREYRNNKSSYLNIPVESTTKHTEFMQRSLNSAYMRIRTAEIERKYHTMTEAQREADPEVREYAKRLEAIEKARSPAALLPQGHPTYVSAATPPPPPNTQQQRLVATPEQHQHHQFPAPPSTPGYQAGELERLVNESEQWVPPSPSPQTLLQDLRQVMPPPPPRPKQQPQQEQPQENVYLVPDEYTQLTQQHQPNNLTKKQRITWPEERSSFPTLPIPTPTPTPAVIVPVHRPEMPSSAAAVSLSKGGLRKPPEKPKE